MAQTYAEMLAENGASPEDIKLLDTPAARKVHEKLQAAAVEAKRRSDDIVRQNDEWRTQVETQNQAYLRERDSAILDRTAVDAKFKKLQEMGLLEVAERMEPGSTQPKPGETAAFDPKLLEGYVPRDAFLSAVEQEGNAIATVQDIAWEHQQLFGNDPAKRLNFRQLREEAKTRKVSFERLWEERYNVPAAREARAAKEKTEYDARIAADAVTKYKSEHPETNPMLGPQTISRTPFTGRVISAGEGANRIQPWQKSDAEKENARVARALPSLEKAGFLN